MSSGGVHRLSVQPTTNEEDDVTTTKGSGVQTKAVKVPGATLHVEVRGTGPVLVCIPGGPADAGAFNRLAPQLEDRYTVVAYDPRGNSRSVFDGEPTDVPIATHADDALAVIDAVSPDEPVHVLGSSGGANIGLELVRRHGGRVTSFVAHEPPVVRLVPASEGAVERVDEISQTYATQGLWPAMEQFGALVVEGGPDYQPPSDPTPEEIAGGERMGGNLDFFIKHVLREISLYSPDVDALKAASTRIHVGIGEESGEQLAKRCGLALCERLGIEPTSLPGAHGGFESDAEAFAKILDATLQG
jgi:pimeloyl-ACP methyl ester carboxylesterase